MSARWCLFFAALSGFVVVATGAFAAHLLKPSLPERLYEVLQTGVQYQMFHTLALLLVGVLLKSRPSRLIKLSGLMFLLGICCFSGSLYLLALTGTKWFGVVTPLGGLLLLAGWLLLALATLRHKE